MVLGVCSSHWRKDSADNILIMLEYPMLLVTIWTGKCKHNQHRKKPVLRQPISPCSTILPLLTRLPSKTCSSLRTCRCASFPPSQGFPLAANRSVVPVALPCSGLGLLTCPASELLPLACAKGSRSGSIIVRIEDAYKSKALRAGQRWATLRGSAELTSLKCAAVGGRWTPLAPSCVAGST